MIEYVEIRSKSTREIIGLIDSFSSVIWHTTYYGVGDFEIYCIASTKHVNLLKVGNWVTRTDEEGNYKNIGVIEKVVSENTVDKGTMLIASGRFAKSILDRRHIYRLSGKVNKATTLSGRVETAVRGVVQNNIINCSFDTSRNISFLQLGTLAGITKAIVDEEGNASPKQVSYENLLEYTDEVLTEYELGSIVCFDDETLNLKYTIYEGVDRSVDNTAGNDPIVFSQDYDNLLESEYSYDESEEKTCALIGGEGEGVDRFYTIIKGTETGLDRREMFVDASSISKKYKDDDDVEHTYTDAEYRTQLKTQGKQELAEAVAETNYEADINVNGGIWRLNEDYFIGDIVTFQDNKLDMYANVRITELTEVQDENGYAITPVFDFTDVEIYERLLITESNVLMSTESGLKLEA